jgi:ZIP family zinc transporter
VVALLTPLLVGLAASSALVVGAVAGAFWKPPKKLVAVALAFSAGALITALAYDLFEEAFKEGGTWLAGGGLLAGAAVFIVADRLIERYGGSSGSALVAGVTTDGIPENLALGVALIGSSLTGILSLLAAIWASNLPEALGGARSMTSNKGRSKKFAIGIWVVTAVLLTAAVVIGNAVFAGVDKDVLAFIRAFAGGAVLASVVDTIMPQAYEEGSAYVAFATAAGFLMTFVITHG